MKFFAEVARGVLKARERSLTGSELATAMTLHPEVMASAEFLRKRVLISLRLSGALAYDPTYNHYSVPVGASTEAEDGA